MSLPIQDTKTRTGTSALPRSPTCESLANANNRAKYEDIAYGVQDCVKLAKGELLDANGRPLPAEDCTQNADS